MKRQVLAILIISCAALSVTQVSCGQSRADYDALRVANIRLREEVDSLRREVARLRGSMSFDAWGTLTGMEEDGASSGLFVMKDDIAPQSRSFSGPTGTQYMTEMRLAMPCVTFGYNKALDRAIDVYTLNKRKSMPYIIGRFNAWLPLFRETFRRHGVPEEIIALCIVESAMSPKALSPAGAMGIWQFMPGTARQYGLRVDQWVDERMDISKATDAAARLLADNYRMFGRWDLAVDAYNCGPGGIRRALVRSNNAQDLWRINEFLPAETQNYFPALVAVRYTILFGPTMGITPVEYLRPDITFVTPGRQVTLKGVSDATGVQLKALLDLNPHVLKGVVPQGAGFYIPTANIASIRTWLEASSGK